MSQIDRVALIRDRLTAEFNPVSLEIEDDSQKHAGHASAKGGGHFNVTIVAEAFAGKSLVQRHRMVFAVLKEAMESEIHALSIKDNTPGEAAG